MYEYKCTILRVIDGDSVIASVDLGFRISIEMRFRLTGINAPEMRTTEGPAAKKRLMELLPEGSETVVKTKKDKQEKYGRYLGTFDDIEGHQVNARMIDEGYAVRFMD